MEEDKTKVEVQEKGEVGVGDRRVGRQFKNKDAEVLTWVHVHEYGHKGRPNNSQLC